MFVTVKAWANWVVNSNKWLLIPREREKKKKKQEGRKYEVDVYSGVKAV